MAKTITPECEIDHVEFNRDVLTPHPQYTGNGTYLLEKLYLVDKHKNTRRYVELVVEHEGGPTVTHCGPFEMIFSGYNTQVTAKMPNVVRMTMTEVENPKWTKYRVRWDYPEFFLVFKSGQGWAILPRWGAMEGGKLLSALVILGPQVPSTSVTNTVIHHEAGSDTFERLGTKFAEIPWPNCRVSAIEVRHTRDRPVFEPHEFDPVSRYDHMVNV